MSLEELYRQVILDHYRNPRHHDPLPHPNRHAEGVNPLCGDEISVDLVLDGERVVDVGVHGRGCSISQASASMMSDAIAGKSLDEIKEIATRFHTMLQADEDEAVGLDPDRPGAVLGDLEALQGVRRYPVRIKCAALAWTTLEQAIEDGAAAS